MNTATVPIHPAWTEDAAFGLYGTMGEPVAPLGPVPAGLVPMGPGPVPVPLALGGPVEGGPVEGVPVVALADEEPRTLR